MVNNIEDLKIYSIAMKMGDEVWEIVNALDYFQKDTIGKQLIKAVDSVAANISEGYGRFHYKDSKNFHYYSRGSLYETKTWLTKAHNRGLVSDEVFQQLMKEWEVLVKMLNSYIKTIGGVNEPEEPYGQTDNS